MAKVLKIVGEVVAVGALALATAGFGGIAISGIITTGVISTGTLLAVGAGLTLAGGLLGKKPSVSPAQQQRTQVSLTLDDPRKIVFGHTALATDLRYQEVWGAEQEYLSQVLVVASHWVAAIEQIWFDGALAWDINSGVQGAYAGYLSVGTRAQATSANAYHNDWSNNWSGNAAMVGCADVYLQFRVLGLNDKAGGPFSSSVPSRMVIRGRCAPVYDPRRDDSVGGSGTMRAADQSTWAFTAGGVDVGRNPALCLLFYLLGWRIQNPVTGGWKLAVGCGVPVDRIDLASFMTAATICDEPVTLAAGGTEPRYRCDGMFSEGDDPNTVITAFEGAMNAKLRDSGGRFALQVFVNDLAAPVLDLTDDDVLGDFTWDAGGALNELKNRVKGRYTDPSDTALYQLTDYPPISLASLDGIDRIDPVDYALVQSPSQAQRLAKQRLQRHQYAGTFSADFKARAWALKDGDVVRLTFGALAFVQKLFRVSKATIQATGIVPLILVEENAAVYAWDAEERPAVIAAAPIAFDRVVQPLVLAIGDTNAAVLQTTVANSFPVGLTLTAHDDGSITISDHARRYTDGHPDVSVAGTTLTATGLAAGDFRAIYYDDPARVGGAVTYHLDADDIDARASPAHPARHYLGYVVIPTAGGGDSSGGGAVPPGGNCVTTDTPVLLADGSAKPAGELTVGDRLWTRHEERLGGTGGWGVYPVEAIAIVDSEDVWAATIGGRSLEATGDHLVYVAGAWSAMRTLGTKLDGTRRVVKLTVTGAHTYVSNGVLSHNIKDPSGL